MTEADEAQAEVNRLAAALPLSKPVIELPRLSHSQLSSWMRCGEQYRLQRIEGAPQRPAAWLASGTAFHAAMEAWEGSARGLTTAEAVVVAHEAYDAEVVLMMEAEPDVSRWLTGGRTKPEVDLKRRREKVGEWIAAYIVHALAQPWSIWNSPDGPAIELGFVIEFSGCIVRGYIDQITCWPDQTLEVVDAKTGAKQPDSPDQLGLYALGMEVTYGEEFRPEIGHYYMAKDSKTTRPVDLSGYTFAKLERWFNNFAKARELELYIPHISDSTCGPCGVADFCEAIDGESADLYHPDPDVRMTAEALAA